VPEAGFYAEILNSDATVYWGSGIGNLGGVESEPEPWHGFPHSIKLTLPPLSTLMLKKQG
jgi:1,4-alpha-glucan branching enzyme